MFLDQSGWVTRPHALAIVVAGLVTMKLERIGRGNNNNCSLVTTAATISLSQLRMGNIRCRQIQCAPRD